MTPTDAHGHGHNDPHDPSIDHEHSDIDIKTVMMSAVGMFVVVAFAAVAMWVLFRVLDRQAAANDPVITPLAAPAGQLPPMPRLQTNEPGGLAKFRHTEQETLDGYGWVDQAAGVARIPIADAKKLILQRGLAARTGAENPREGTNAPAYGEATGGRSIPIK